jgi:NAD(P)-dependent dehydrogenase (short-subunit alcohol dehydrogenase family)
LFQREPVVSEVGRVAEKGWDSLTGGTNMRLDNKVAIVTGASREGQVGETIVEALALEGADVVIAARTQKNIDRMAEKVRALGRRALAVKTDCTSEDEVNNLVQVTLSELGQVDVLVNMAGGLTKYGPLVQMTVEDWDYEYGINLKTAFLCSKAVLEPMTAAKSGKIINFSSASGLSARANMGAYNCAKAGIVALTRTLALETRRDGIHVNAVAPGLVDTKSNIKAMQPKDLSTWVKREDIAKTVVFLSSDESNGITGQVIPVFGAGIG